MFSKTAAKVVILLIRNRNLVKIMSKCQVIVRNMTFFLANFINKKYPAGRLPDILSCKLHSGKNAFVAF